MDSPSVTSTVDRNELIRLCAVDGELFNKVFFPKAFRQAPPSFAPTLNASLDNPNYRLYHARIFRGGAKTTRLRAYAARRIAYGISRTILYVGAGEDHATRSVQWLRSQIEAKMGADGSQQRSMYAATFDLKPGRKWQEHEIEIIHGIDARPIWVLGVGITGNIRGINFDDYRPDLIILDDVMKDENATTVEQRAKIHDLVMGALRNSLVPRSEDPTAKMVLLDTSLDPDDVGSRAMTSSEWHNEVFGCWTKDTADLPVEQQESAWPERYPSVELRKEKLAALADNRLSIFAREMECNLIPAETRSFRTNWVRFYDQAPKGAQCVLVIDPVPPPSDQQLRKNLAGKDYEAQAVVGRYKGEYYLLDYRVHRGHEPNWSAATMFELAHRWKIGRIVLETIAAQRYLKWVFQQEMGRKGVYYAIKDAPPDQRPKFTRIITALSGPASAGKFWCRKEHTEFLEQFQSYGIGYRGHDDLLEVVAAGVRELTNPYLELAEGEYADITDDSVEAFPFRRICP